MAEGQDMQLILNALATVSEDLAVELLSSYTEDDLGELANVISHLTRAAEVLTTHQIEAPYAVTSLIQHFETHQGKLPLQQ
jgi:hypothetical protein